MIHSKAIDVLKTFSKEELKQFSDFVRSPFFNKNKNLIKLIDVLKEYHPDFSVDNEKVYTKIYLGKAYNHDNMKKLMSEMLEITENFLSYVSYEKEIFQKRFYKLKELEFRRLDSLFSLNFQKLEKEIMDRIIDTKFDEKADLENLKVGYYLNRNQFNKAIPHYTSKGENNLVQNFINLLNDIGSLKAIKYDYGNEIKTLSLDKYVKCLNIDKLIESLNLDILEERIICLSLNLIKISLNNANVSNYINAKNILFNFPIDELILIPGEYFETFYSGLRNYCAYNINLGNFKYRYDMFEIDKYIFKQIKNSITKFPSGWHSLTNIMSNAIAINEIVWAENFVNYYFKLIPEDFREDFYYYTLSHIEFAKRNFEKCLEFSSKVDINTRPSAKTGIRIRMLMCYFELNLFESALNYLDSYSHFLSKNRGKHLEHINQSEKFILIFRKLLKLKMNPEKINKYDISNIKLSANDVVIGKKWLLEKAEELQIRLFSDKRNKRGLGSKSA